MLHDISWSVDAWSLPALGHESRSDCAVTILSVTSEQSHYGGLTRPVTAPLDPLEAFRRVNVAGLRPPMKFSCHRDLPAHLLERLGLHGDPDHVEA